jgi:hypothetical protein
MEKSNELKTSAKNNQLETLQSTENLLKELNNLHAELGKAQTQSGGAKKKSSKKASKKGSKKSSKKGSKKASKKSSKKASKKGSKKASKKGSKSMKGGAIEELVGGRTAPPALLEGVKTNRTIQDKLGCKGGPGLISFVNQKLRIPAKKEVKDPTDYKALNKKMLEIFEEYVSKHGKSKVAEEVNKMGEQIRSNRTKKNSKK